MNEGSIQTLIYEVNNETNHVISCKDNDQPVEEDVDRNNLLNETIKTLKQLEQNKIDEYYAKDSNDICSAIESGKVGPSSEILLNYLKKGQELNIEKLSDLSETDKALNLSKLDNVVKSLNTEFEAEWSKQSENKWNQLESDIKSNTQMVDLLESVIQENIEANQNYKKNKKNWKQQNRPMVDSLNKMYKDIDSGVTLDYERVNFITTCLSSEMQNDVIEELEQINQLNEKLQTDIHMASSKTNSTHNENPDIAENLLDSITDMEIMEAEVHKLTASKIALSAIIDKKKENEKNLNDFLISKYPLDDYEGDVDTLVNNLSLYYQTLDSKEKEIDGELAQLGQPATCSPEFEHIVKRVSEHTRVLLNSN